MTKQKQSLTDSGVKIGALGRKGEQRMTGSAKEKPLQAAESEQGQNKQNKISDMDISPTERRQQETKAILDQFGFGIYGGDK